MPGATGHLLPLLLSSMLPGFAHALLDNVTLYLKAAGHRVHIYLALDGVGDIGHRIGNLVNEVGLFQGIISGILQQEVGLEHNAVLLVVPDIVLNFFQGVFLGEGIRVVSVRQEHHARVHALFENKADGADGGMQAGLVSVVHDGDVLRELLDEAHLLLGEGGAAGGHYVGDAHLVHHHYVHVAFYQDAAVLFGHFGLGKVNAQEVAALDIDFRFRRVHILGGVVTLEGAAAEGNDTPAHRMDGEHHTLPELVYQRAVFLLDGQAGCHQVFVFVTGGAGGVYQGAFPGRGPAQAPLLNGGVFNVAGAVIVVAHGAAFSFLELVAEILAGKFAHSHEAFAALTGGNLLGRFFLFLYLNVVLAGQIAKGLGIRHVLVVHHKAHGAAGLAAAEALVNALGGRYVERGSFLVVEGTAGHVAGPAALERHEVSDNLLNAGGVKYLVNCLFRNHKLLLFEINLFGIGAHGNFATLGRGRCGGFLPLGHVMLLLPENFGLVVGVSAVPYQGEDAQQGNKEATPPQKEAANGHKNEVFSHTNPAVIVSYRCHTCHNVRKLTNIQRNLRETMAGFPEIPLAQISY